MKNFSRQTLNTFIVGLCVGVTLILTYMLLSGNLPWLKAAGVGTGAPDVNARYLDGYSTSLSAGASKIYISDGSNYLPDSTVDSGAIVNGTIVSDDIADGTIVSANIAANTIVADDIAEDAVGISEIAADAVGQSEIATDGVGAAEIAANAVGDSELNVVYTWPDDIVCGAGFADMGTYCIQTNEAGSNSYWAASDYCHDHYGGARLCSLSEWYNACVNGVLADATDDWEYINLMRSNKYPWRQGLGGCAEATQDYDDTTVYTAFRCCK